MKLGETGLAALASVESDTQELATLVEEILAFSRAGNRQPRLQILHLEPIMREVLEREADAISPELIIPPELIAVADVSLFSRAMGNLIRNTNVHASPHARVVVTAVESSDHVAITIADDGRACQKSNLPAFYRPDRSRSRDTGGNGLGLAIVRTAIEACGGETTASAPKAGGFSVTIRLRKSLRVQEGWPTTTVVGHPCGRFVT